MSKPRNKHIIGRTDRIDLPELKLENVACKIDTGAYTSTLHCTGIRLADIDGESALAVKFYDPSFGFGSEDEYFFKEYKQRKVRSSNGDLDQRYSIKTQVVVFGRRIKTEFTLSFRKKMRFPILLGRQFLRRRFTVDVDSKELSYKNKLTQ